MNPLPPSVNFHLWQTCNMRCRFCFAGFEDSRVLLPKGHLPEEACLELNRLLARTFDKVTFVGGEPTLCPWLPRLIREAREIGTTIMLVTNGSRLTDGYLEALAGQLQWLTLSIDSARPETHLALGRAARGAAIEPGRYLAMVRKARALGMRIKINTVVTALSQDEDMTAFIAALAPKRWKLFQVLPIEGENTGTVEPLLISREAFERFVARHRGLEALGVSLAPEHNEAMTGSYAMIDPAGRFFDNTLGRLTYSEPILEVGIERAWSQVAFLEERFEARGGRYAWREPAIDQNSKSRYQ